MSDLVDWTNTMRNSLHPIELASQMHRRFVYIHPFPDGNGRIARLLMNTVLLQGKYMPVVIDRSKKKHIYKHLKTAGSTRPALTSLLHNVNLNSSAAL